MRVVHIGQEHSEDDIRIVRKECATLISEGIEAIYITQQKEKRYSGEKICGVSVYTYEPYKMKIDIPILTWRLNRFFSRRRAMKLAISLNASVFHIHEVELYQIARYLKKRGKKLIFDQHEDSPGQRYQIEFERYHSSSFAKASSRIANYQEKSMVRNSDLVIAASEMIAQNIKNYQIKKNIVVIHNYAHNEATRCNMDDYLERERIICYAGGLFERRGIKYVVDSMYKVNGFFEFAGKLDTMMQKVYESSAGWKNCRYLGCLSRDEVNRLYERSRIGIINNLDLPYHRNSNPNKLFEYMAAGLPIICTSIPAWAEIVNDAGCGLVVNATNEEEISDAINYLLDNPKKAQNMGQKGYAAFINKYNWDVEKGKLIKAYRNL